MLKTPMLMPLLKKLQRWASLTDRERQAILSLPLNVQTLRPLEYIARENDHPKHSCLLLSGFAVRHKSAGNGGRQIFAIHMKDDLVDLHNSLVKTADHDVQTLTAAEVAFIAVSDLEDIGARYPAIAKAMWRETLVDFAVFREWSLNVGRRDARTRMAHMLCELALRVEVAGVGKRHDYELPMTQEQLADALALTPVHINRTLKALGKEGLIERNQRSVRIMDFEQLARVGDFDPKYLHLIAP